MKKYCEGHSFGIFGCNSHQHDLPLENKSEIVFKDKPEAEQFIKTNFYSLYGKGISMNKGKYRQFPCRRKQLQPGMDSSTTGHPKLAEISKNQCNVNNNRLHLGSHSGHIVGHGVDGIPFTL